MKKNYLITLAACALSVVLLASAFANHRTGTLALPELIVAGDFNQDGKLDVAVNVTGFDHIAILLGDALGGFTLSGRVPTDTLPKGLVTADINRDGHLDLVGCNNWGYSAEVHFGDGLGGFGFRDNFIKGEGGPNRLVLGDFNNDRALDMAVNGPDENVCLIYFGDHKGGFLLPPNEIEDDIPNNQGLATADFNGDGNFDLAFSAFPIRSVGGTHVELFFGDGSGQFPTHNETLVGDLAETLAPADLNNDGKLDLVVAGAGPENETGNFLQTLLGDGAGNLTVVQTIPLESMGSIKGKIAVADFDEDGNVDVAMPITFESPNGPILHLFFGDGTGNMIQAPDLTPGHEPHSVIAPDVNSDGHADLIVTNRTDGTISVFLGDGTGAFNLVNTISVVCEGGVCD